MDWTAMTFLKGVVQPALVAIGLGGPAAENLVLGTAIQESGEFRWKLQQGGGPALGYFQMEPRTAADIWSSFLAGSPKLASKTAALLSPAPTIQAQSRIDELATNDVYAGAMCRIEYFRFEVSDPLPTNSNDIPALARYWKKHYNTYAGRGTVDDFIFHWDRATSPPASSN